MRTLRSTGFVTVGHSTFRRTGCTPHVFAPSVPRLARIKLPRRKQGHEPLLRAVVEEFGVREKQVRGGLVSVKAGATMAPKRIMDDHPLTQASSYLLLPHTKLLPTSDGGAVLPVSA